MDVEFGDESLDRLETAPRFNAGLPIGAVKGYRKVLNWIRAARDERDFYSFRALNFERLKGSRRHQYSMRLNGQYRLIMEFVENGGRRKVLLVEITDYH